MPEKRLVYTGDISKGKSEPVFVVVNPLPTLKETAGRIAYAKYIIENNIPYIETLMRMPDGGAIPCAVYKLRDGEKEDTILITDGFIAWIDDHGVFLKTVWFTYFVRK